MPASTVAWSGCAAANFRVGRAGGVRPIAVVLHVIVGSLGSARNTFRNPTIVPHRSAHYGIGRDGRVEQFVAEIDTAYHVGVVDRPSADIVKSRPGENPNDYTIGIEHEGYPNLAWTSLQLEASGRLVGELARRWDIPVDQAHILLHHEIRTSKSCPGPLVDRPEVLRLAQAASAPPPTGLPGEAARVPQRLTVARSVNVRALPSLSAAVIAVLPSGAQIGATATVNGENPVGRNAVWYRLEQPAGYVWSGAVES